MPIELATAASRTEPGIRKARPPQRRGRGVGTKDRMFFTERLALLLHTGTPLHSSLRTLEEQAGNPELREVIGSLSQDVQAGLSLGQSLRRHPEVFPRSYASLVDAGEAGGFLPVLLDRLQEMDARREELRSTLVSSLSYPGFLVVFSFAVVLFVLVVVFPKFGDLFTLIRDQLPITTVVLMGMSDGLRHYWIPIVASLGVGAFLGWRWASRPEGAAFLDRLSMRLPVLRDVAVQLHLVQFLHVMSLSLTHGVPMVEALRSAQDTVRSAVFRAFVADLDARVSRGEEFAAGFEQAGFLPLLARQMVATGEATGNLATVMGRVADFYEREWRRKLTLISKIAEPAMLVLMGGVVGLIVSSLILPIFKLSRAVH